MLEFLFRRLKPSRLASTMVFATTEQPEDDALVEIARRSGFSVFRGSRDDVVSRFVGAADRFDIEYVVRITADCPFVDAATLDHCVARCLEAGEFDLATTKGAFPVGIDFEVYRAKTMKALHDQGKLNALDREHLTKHIYDHPKDFNIIRLQPPGRWAGFGPYTVDTPEDYSFACGLADRFPNGDFSVPELLALEGER